MASSLSDHPQLLFLAVVLVASALNDVRRQKIPNLLTYPTALFGLLFYGFTQGLDGIVFAASGLALGIGLLIVPYLMGGMGAGDVKLLGAAGAVLGPKGVLNAFLATALAGGFYAAVVLLVHRGYLKTLLSNSTNMIKMFAATGTLGAVPADYGKKPMLCYGVAIAVGTLFTIGWQALNSGFPFL